MESLSEILSGATVPDANASAPEGNAEQAKDDKSADSGKTESEASATSAEQATEGNAKSEGESKDKAEGEEKPDRARDEKGRFDKTDGKDKSGKPDEVIAGLQAALTAARKKSQELERKAKEQQPKDEKPKKDFWEDPEAAIGERVSAEVEKVRREADARFFASCERLAKAKHDNYEEVVSSLIEETETDPILAQQVFSKARESDDPAEFLYSYAHRRRELKAFDGDIEKRDASIKKPLEDKVSELEKENKALKDKLEKLGKIPSSLNAQPSATRAAVESEAVEDESLEEITKPRKRRA